MKPGDPGLETWENLNAAQHGGAQPWLPGVYDPETKLYIFGTGNPTPAYTVGRGEGDNLFTCSLVAVNVDTGKVAWGVKTDQPLIGGVLATAGNLVFNGEANGWFKAFDATNGKELWKFNAGAGVNAPAVSYMVNGKQYIDVAAGGNNQIDAKRGNSVFVFALP